MALIKIDWQPDARTLKHFGLVALIGFSALGVFFIWWSFSPYFTIAAFALAAITALAAALAPKAALPVYWSLMAFAWLMGQIMSRLILLFLFYLLITPLGFLMRLVGRDRLRLKECGTATSYWVEMPPQPAEPQRYQRLF